jgi:hypothetical protein
MPSSRKPKSTADKLLSARKHMDRVNAEVRENMDTYLFASMSGHAKLLSKVWRAERRIKLLEQQLLEESTTQ